MASSPNQGDDHFSADFRVEFPTWHDLRRHVSSIANHPEFDERRALHQILAADFAARLPSVDNGEWMLFGSLSLPTRVPLGWEWPEALAPPPGHAVDMAYLAPRTAFDLDLCALGIAEGGPSDPEAAARHYGERVNATLHEVASPSEQPGTLQGLGLGGLVRYIAGDLRIFDNGQVMGVITAQPVDTRHSLRYVPPIDDPIQIEIDVKPRSKVVFSGKPEDPQRPITGISLPGFSPPALPLYPTANQFADKACLLVGPPVSMRTATAAPWHRYKDLFDLYFIVQSHPMDGTKLREALETNWNLGRAGITRIPAPYRLYGDRSRPGEPPVPWNEGCERLRSGVAQLQRWYPDFKGLRDSVSAYIDQLPGVNQASQWHPSQGWTPTAASERRPSRPAQLGATAFPHPAGSHNAPTLQTPPDTKPKPGQPPSPPHQARRS